MHKNRTSICRICGENFIPAWNHPEQKVCYKEVCRRKAAAERTRKYTKKVKSTQAGRLRYTEKERQRYLKRKDTKYLFLREKVNPTKRISIQTLNNEIVQMQIIIDGLLQIINEKFGWQLTVESCYSKASKK